MNIKSLFYIEHFNLKPHPEGGYFKEVYRADETIKKDCLPARYKGDRNFSTSIYFLLEGGQTSKFHRLKSDEQWHFYDGCSVKIYTITKYGKLDTIILGADISNGAMFQTVIKSGDWFAAELIDKNSFCLIGCVVAPGFKFNDFELAKRGELISEFPQHKQLIEKFTV